ncbi:MAG: BrnT family toxin [Armatimonadota bacterium]
MKAEKNLDKHKVAFFEAATVFADNFNITFPDPDHSADEERFVTMGISQNGRLLVIAHTDRDGRIRIISAREMTRNERHYYEENR